MLILALAAAFVFGACAGSFLGVVVHRMPRGLSIVRPRSRCGACGTALAGHDNLPILGWLLLRGRCRHCGTAIPVSCLWMEVVVGAITALVTWAALEAPQLHSQWLYAVGAGLPDPGAAFWLPQVAALTVLLLLVWLLIAEVLIDWDHLMLPDELTKGLQAVAIPLATLTASNLLWPWLPIGEHVVSLGVLAVTGNEVNWNLDPGLWFVSRDVMDGLIGTPGRAALYLGITAFVGLALIAVSLLVARRVYGGLRQAWDDRDHHAMAQGVWWYLGCTTFWTVLAIFFIANLSGADFTRAGGGYPYGPYLAFALTQAVLGSLVGWWLPWIVGLVGTIVFKRNAMGYGDVKLFCGLGAFLGPFGTLVAFALATVVGTCIGIPARFLGAGREMPFGPSLAIGAVLTVALGPWLAPLLFGRFLG